MDAQQFHNSIHSPPLLCLAETFAKLDSYKAKLNTFRPLEASIVKNLRDAMVLQYTYHSNAIEGNTLTLFETKVILEDGLTIGGKSMHEHLEAINHKEAIYYLEEIVSQKQTLNEHILRSIHQIILHNILPKEAGIYRKKNVLISGAGFTPPEHYRVQEYMTTFFDWYTKNATKALHPIERATRIHADFVNIHPFLDGNGRTARLIMNLELMQAGFPTLILSVEERHIYYKNLDIIATTGNYIPLAEQLCKALEKSFTPYWQVLGIA